MTKRVYIETTIPSYLAALPSRGLIQAARQQITHEWWMNERQKYDLCISEIVLEEATAGDTEAVQRRLPFLQDLPLLDLTATVHDIATAIVDSGLLPRAATRDAVHIAVSSVHNVDILLTWNCRHISQCDDNERAWSSGGRMRLRHADPLYAGGTSWRVIDMGQINEKETTDEVIREVRRIKEALAASVDFDVGRVLENARQKQHERGRTVLAPPIRKATQRG